MSDKEILLCIKEKETDTFYKKGSTYTVSSFPIYVADGDYYTVTEENSGKQRMVTLETINEYFL